MHSRLLEELTQTHIFEQPLKLRPIPGGAVNLSYHLRAGGDDYFLKIYEQNHVAPSDRETLYCLQIHLSQHGIAPAPRYFARNHNFQVEDWVEGCSLAHTDMAPSRKIEVLAQTLCKIHQLPIYALSINFPLDWQGYIDSAGLRISDGLQRRLDHNTECWLQTHQHDQVLCHNDLAMEHVFCEEHLVVLDWEYAACGNRYYDLASCAIVNKLNQQEIHSLQLAYSKSAGIPFAEVIKKMQRQVPLVDLTNELWYLAARVNRSSV